MHAHVCYYSRMGQRPRVLLAARCSNHHCVCCCCAQEAKRFLNIDKQFMKIVGSALETINVINTCYGNEGMRTTLPWLHEQLELCQKSLSAYLEQKRAEFPR